MKSKTRFVVRVIGGAAVGLACAAQALTLGELRGTAFIGQPLDVSVALQTGAGDDVSAACLSAEVFHADARQAPTTLTLVPGEAGALRVKVHSAALVDEPVVSLELRASCGNTATRRYTLLADIVPVSASLANAPVAVSPAWSVAAPAARPSETALSAGDTQNPASAAVSTRPAVAPRERVRSAAPVRPAVVSKPAKKPAATVAMAKAAPSQKAVRSKDKPVLKLDPLEVLSDRIDGLDASQLFDASVDALNQARQVAAMEQDIKTLRERLAKSDAELRSLKSQLQAAQDAQIPVLWVIVLAALVLLCLAAIAWLLLQQRRARAANEPKWHDSQLPADPPAGPAVAQRREPSVTPVATRLTTPSKPVLSGGQGSAAKAKAEPAAPPPSAPSEPATQAAAPAVPSLPSGIEGLHSFSVEPILDLRQQADFFVSLGQTDRAVSILKKQIDSAPEPNPFIYLDLMALYHALGLKSDFRDCREVFNRSFNGVMPDFPAFHLEGRDLLDYPEVLKQLVEDWPSAKTLVLLNAWIFRNPKASAHPAFDLAAFRDLLLLHALAEELATDLAWDTVSPSLPAEPAAKAEPDTGIGFFEIDSGALSVPPSPPAKGPGASLPEELRMHSLDMDFSALGTAPAARTPPPAEEPRPTEPGRL